MELIDYPQAIADASREFLAAEEQVRQLEKEVEQLKLTIDSQVYFDPKLKNQNQRDCCRAEILRDNAQYQAMLIQLETARRQRSSARLHLKYLQDRFAALKLSVLAKMEFLIRVQSPDDVRVHLAGLGLEGLFSSYGGVRLTTPSKAADQILAFVEALTTKLREGRPMSDEQWIQKMSTPEFLPEEDEGAEFEDSDAN
jgi:hypothetical protein